MILLLNVFPGVLLSHAAPFRVVIDPGHGGSDEGTVFQKGSIRLAEKALTLALAQETARYLTRKGYQVFLTRNNDQDLALPSRTAFANKIGADVFFSIHMNSIPDSQKGTSYAEGSETYILNHSTDAATKRLAQIENSVNPSQQGGPTDVALILKDLRLDANLSESERLACGIQRNLIAANLTFKKRYNYVRNRGVKQALFHVLLGADMPSVLVEAGFLSSSSDRAMLTSSEGRRFIAQALARAVAHFHKNKGSQQAMIEVNRCKIN